MTKNRDSLKRHPRL